MDTFYAATHSFGSPIRVGSHYFATYLSQHAQVSYHSHPISLASIANFANNQLKSRWALAVRGGREESPTLQEITTVMPLGPGPAPLFNSVFCSKHGWKVAWPRPSQQIKHRQFDQVWLDTFFQSYWANLLNPTELFVRVADHPRHITHLSPALQNSFNCCLRNATLIIAPTHPIAEYLAEFTSRPIRVVPNGVDAQRFAVKTQRPDSYGPTDQINIVFVGALARWIDFNLIAALGQLRPTYHFWLVGPSHTVITTSLPKNVHTLGPMLNEYIPAYLQHAHATLAPFDCDRYPDLVNSVDAVKLYEYIAAGTPVVATRWPQSRALEPYVVTTDQTAGAFAAALDEVIANRDKYVAPQPFIDTLDWTHRLAFLDELVSINE